MTSMQFVVVAVGIAAAAMVAVFVFVSVIRMKMERVYEGLARQMLADVHRKFGETLAAEIAKGRDRHAASLTAYLSSLDLMCVWQTRILISKYSSGGHAKGRYSKERIAPIVERACESARRAGESAARELSAVSPNGVFSGPISPLIEEIRNRALEDALKDL